MKKIFLLILTLPLIVFAKSEPTVSKDGPMPAGRVFATGGSGGGSIDEKTTGNPSKTDATATALGTTPKKICPLCISAAKLRLDSQTNPGRAPNKKVEDSNSNGADVKN
jgi:hypothetical protein